MTAQTHRIEKTLRLGGQRERFEYRALVAVSFLPCLIYTAYATLSGRLTQTPGESIAAQALSSARAAVGYAYMA